MTVLVTPQPTLLLFQLRLFTELLIRRLLEDQAAALVPATAAVLPGALLVILLLRGSVLPVLG